MVFPMSFIEAVDVSKLFGDVEAVAGVSLEVWSGEFFGLFGPNGAGKTTTIRMLYGYTPRDAGQLEVFGLDIDQGLREIKRRIGICQQEDSLDPDLSVRDNLVGYARYFAISRNEAERRADELLSFFALQNRANDKIMVLSGGLKRRLMLARALVNHPELLILDEPTTGLDPQSRQLLWDKLAELKRQGLTILLTTHYMEEAEQLCDRVAVMDHGRIIAMDTPEALINQHFQETAIEFVALGQLPRERLAALPGVTQTRFENGHATLYSTDVPRTMAGLFELVTASALAFKDMTVRQATLEDVFLKLTGRRIRA